MIIKKDHSISKKEDISIIPFLEYYCKSTKGDVHFSGIAEEINKCPDYYLETTNELIEVKEIHDRESNQKHAQWGKIITRLQKAVDANSLLSQVNGTFLVNTPDVFKTPTEQKAFDSASTQVIQAVVDNKKAVKVFGFEFEIKKVSKQERIIVFGTLGTGGFIDPSNTVYENIKDKIIIANKQLGNPPNGINPLNRILLLVNKYYFPLWNWDLFKAISRVYKELLSYENIDEIWYQFETKDNGFLHHLLYRKSFFEQLEGSKLTKYNSDDLELFANWFSALAELGDEKKSKLLIALKVFLENKKPYEIFPNSQTREEMARFGLWLAEKELFDDTIWLVEQFITDIDPPKPEKYKEDEKFNYHKQVINNEDANIITTVLGHLAWVIQKLAVKKEYIVKALQLTKKLLDHPNVYVKLQSIIPLIEISARRQWLEENDKKNGSEFYGEFRNIAFDLLKNYSQYQAIANSLSHVFYYFKDLDTYEATEVLEKLKKANEVAALYVYFGIFRDRHYQNKVDFDPKPLRDQLDKTILDQEREGLNLKGSIAWNFWRILAETPVEFDTLKPYLDLFFTLPYNKRYYSSLERIIEEWIERKPDICIPWFISMISKLQETINGDKTVAMNTWIEPEKALQIIAREKPFVLVELVENLVKLWKLGSFVGSPREIFEVYKLVENQELKTQTVEKFRSWYEEMKTINPKLELVEWE